MTTIKERTFDGAAGIGRGSSDPDLATTLQEVADDLTALRAAFVALTAKMDTDFTAQNGAVTSSQLDVNYAATVDPAALKTIRG